MREVVGEPHAPAADGLHAGLAVPDEQIREAHPAVADLTHHTSLVSPDAYPIDLGVCEGVADHLAHGQQKVVKVPAFEPQLAGLVPHEGACLARDSG